MNAKSGFPQLPDGKVEYPFTAEGVQSAQRDLTGGKTTGKLLIKVA